uniref:Uncharacterized protein n=1 Tax=Anguilla anguilla TaxID=7936 RepID=A0A0E9TS03_ANGAN
MRTTLSSRNMKNKLSQTSR